MKYVVRESLSKGNRAMKVPLLAIWLILFTRSAFGATIYVPDDYVTIQGAIDASASGDIVIVRPGTYVENIDFVGKTITVQSEQGAASTVIDGNQAGSVVTIQNSGSKLDGFTITNGSGTFYSSKYYRGGGIYCSYGSSATISNNRITGNMADSGGGICCSSEWFTPTIERCTIVGNLANYGGAMCAQDAWPSVTSCILWDNSAWHGPQLWEDWGGFSVTYCDVEGGYSGTGNINADPLFVDPASGDYHLQQDPCQPGVVNPCVDTGHPNTLCEGTTRTDGVRDSWPADMGYHYPAYSPMIIYVPDDYPTIQGAVNTAADGDTIIVRSDAFNGGPYVEIIDLKNLAITVKSEQGAAATTIDGHQAGSVVTFGEGCTSVLDGFTLTNGRYNDGGGIYCDYPCDPTITNCIITNNTATWDGGGIFCNTSTCPVITNAIVWDNSAFVGPEIHVDGLGEPDVTYSDIKGGWPGTGNIDADPLFADAAGGDYHITVLSPCLDGGSNSVVTQSVDFEGDPRIALGLGVDMGADEYWFHLYHSGPVIPGSSIDLKVVGWPTAPVTLAVADSLVDPPTPTPHGNLYLSWPPLWSGHIGKVPASGILSLPVTVPPGCIPGDAYYLQALVGPWGGPMTLLTNLEALVVQ